jgi:SAM-dependent methyltransferase
MANLQEVHYGSGINYRKGSPHLSNWVLHDRLVELLRTEVGRLDEQGLPLRVLEIGAGHGGFTEPALALNCEVTAVDMSGPAVEELRRRLGGNRNLEVIHDPGGNLHGVGGNYSLLMCVSVLHHIPDYLEFLKTAAERLAPGGLLLTLQDPTWYPRHRAAHYAERATYFTWRLGQGKPVRGLQTRVRRMRGFFDAANPSDMVEYHVVRQGVDEEAVLSFARDRFAESDLMPYWSSHLKLAQNLGQRLSLQSSFGLAARGYGLRAQLFSARLWSGPRWRRAGPGLSSGCGRRGSVLGRGLRRPVPPGPAG